MAGIPDRRTNLLAPVAKIVGRTGELAALDVLTQNHRLVTLVGPPGSGKTRLAIEHARSRVSDYASAGHGGVWMCELSDARTIEGICRAVGRALDVGHMADAGEDESILRLGAAISARGPTMLVLDNFEQVARFADRVLSHWLQIAAELTLIVTSRVRLAIAGEATFDVGPMHLPEAVQLLVHCARGKRSDFAPDVSEAGLLGKLAQNLDGLPLAIELAGARLAVLGPKQLLDRLSQRLDLLTDPRDKTRAALRETLDWSWNLLEAHEQTALAQLSVFRGGFMLDAAEAVLDLKGAPVSVLDTLSALRDHSLLRVTPAAELSGELRFTMLDTIVVYAEERLATSAAMLESSLRRHAHHYLTAGAQWSIGVERDGGPESLNRLAVELPNLGAVHRRALDSGDRDRLAEAFAAVLTLEHVFYMRGPTGLCLSMLDAAFAVGVDGIDRRIVALAKKARARALRDLGRLEEAQQELDDGVAIARDLGDRGLEGRLVGHLAFLAQLRGDLDLAAALVEGALACVRDAGDRRSEGMLLASRGSVLAELGRLDEASAAYDEALRLDRSVGNRYAAGFVLSSRAEIQRARGFLEGARVDLEQGLAVYREFGEHRHEAIALSALGSLLQEQGRYAAAREAHERAIACHREYGNWLVGTAIALLADLEREEGRLEMARSLYTEALTAARTSGDTRSGAKWLLSLAGVEASAGRVAAANVLLREAESTLPAPSPVEAALVALHRAMIDLAAGDLPAAREALGLPRSHSPAVRLAATILERGIASAEEGIEAPVKPNVEALVIARSGRWFRVAGGGTVSLHRRHALRLVLKAFLERRLTKRGEALDQFEVLEAGWPGEKVGAHAGTLRVYNALSALRKLGLRDTLLTRDDGYLLDPHSPIEAADDD